MYLDLGGSKSGEVPYMYMELSSRSAIIDLFVRDIMLRFLWTSNIFCIMCNSFICASQWSDWTQFIHNTGTTRCIALCLALSLPKVRGWLHEIGNPEEHHQCIDILTRVPQTTTVITVLTEYIIELAVCMPCAVVSLSP